MASPHRVIEAGLLGEDFAERRLGELWDSIAHLARQDSSKPIDLIRLSEHSGQDFLAVGEVACATATGENLAWYARQIQSARAERQARAILDRHQDSGLRGAEWVESLKAELGRVDLPVESAGVTAKEGMLQTVEAIGRALEHPGQAVGTVSSGLHCLDRVLGGVPRGVVTIIGGRPSTGKSSLMATIARLAAKRMKRVVYCSLEDKRISFDCRLLAQETGIDGKRIRRGRLGTDEFQQVCDAASTLADLDMQINDSVPRDYRRLLAWVERVGQQCDLLCLDYIQLVKANSHASRNEQLTEISNDLASVVRRLDCGCLVGSQLNRKADFEKPSLGHLRDCGALEADADAVVLLDDFRWNGGRPTDASGEELPVTLARVAKNKNGSTGRVLMHWTPELTLFGDPSASLVEQYQKNAAPAPAPVRTKPLTTPMWS